MSTAAPPGDMPFGVYDPNGEFTNDPDVQIEHLFLPWEDVFLQSLSLADTYARDRGRAVLVTIEPWTWTRSERNRPEVLQRGISDGSYDINMRTICGQLAEFTSPVTIRWGHEMDDESGQFIWAGWETDNYITAYRRAVDVCREVSDDIQFMWSPLGYENMAGYYPGDDYVDVIGLSVFGYEPWEREILGRALSFKEILAPRYERALQFGKPIVVAELGYSGSSDYVANWEKSVRQNLEEFKELRAVIYFNQREVYPWPDGFGYPNWTQSGNVIQPE
jgi:endoglucanase